jgi:hypothetical protein
MLLDDAMRDPNFCDMAQDETALNVELLRRQE